MTAESREARLNAAFVKLADTLTDDYDVVDLLHTLVAESTAILDTHAGGLMLAGNDGKLQLVASTSAKADLVEMMQLNSGKGPCVDCFTSGEPVGVADIENAREDWPEFRAEALKQGFRSLYATPMRLRGEVIGTMNLMCTRVGILNSPDAEAAQALTDVATIGILQERVIHERGIVAEQLQRALDSRILIEQAKGVLSEIGGVSVDQAFENMRTYARSNNLRLHDVAQRVVDRSITLPTSVRTE
jgi:GAF domain-containing protein